MKKRGQSKKAIVEMVNLVIAKNSTIIRDEKLETLEVLRELTEGKLFLEVLI